MFLLFFFCSDVGRRHCVLPRGMPKRKGKDVLDMTKQCTRSFMVRQEEDEEAAAEPEDEDDEDDGGESEGEDEDE